MFNVLIFNKMVNVLKIYYNSIDLFQTDLMCIRDNIYCVWFNVHEKAMFFLEAYNHMNQFWFLHNYENKTRMQYPKPFYSYKISNPVVTEIIFFTCK